MLLHERIKDLRLSRNLTQEQLAQELHISRSAYALYETGKRQLGYDIPVSYTHLTFPELSCQTEPKAESSAMYLLPVHPYLTDRTDMLPADRMYSWW